MSDASAISERTLGEWLESKRVIRGLLAELRPDASLAQLDRWADALIARLAHRDPPLLIGSMLDYPNQDTTESAIVGEASDGSCAL